MKIFFSLFLFIIFSIVAFGQSPNLANEYYKTGEYEKAAELYKRLHKKDTKNSKYFENYIYSLMELEQFKEAEIVIKKRLKSNNGNTFVYVVYGRLYERMDDENNANKYFQKAIKSLKSNPKLVRSLVNLFNSEARYDLSISSYLEAMKYQKNPNSSLYSIGNLYWRLNKKEKAIDYHFQSLEHYPNYLSSTKSFYSGKMNDSLYEMLLGAIYKKVQDKPDVIQYSELLEWIFLMKKKYNKALRQAKSLDKRLDGDGGRVYNLGIKALKGEDFKVAINAFRYVIDTKDKNSNYFLKSKTNLLNARLSLIKKNPNYTVVEFDSLVVEYDSMLEMYGRNSQTVQIMMDQAKLYAEYMGELKQGIKILNEIVGLRNIKKNILAEVKLTLADYYVIDGEVWEATLLYSQVDKAFKEADLGERARFKNAKLFYYNGDFEWAQEQFDFLKSATSKLISNDAIDLSVFITDNLGLDTSEMAMSIYATADLLVFQHKYEEAHKVLDGLLVSFPEHTLQDDVLYTKAKIYSKKRNWGKAIELYQSIVDKYPEEIRADNALYEMALIYEMNLLEIDKAISLYEKIFIDYSGSTFAVEARKKYRLLRGDTVK